MATSFSVSIARSSYVVRSPLKYSAKANVVQTTKAIYSIHVPLFFDAQVLNLGGETYTDKTEFPTVYGYIQ